jgi:predicted DNA-binding protein (UPF0251 family)
VVGEGGFPFSTIARLTRNNLAQEPDKMLGYDDKNLGFDDKQIHDREKVMSTVVEASDLFRRSFPLRRYGKLSNVFYHARRFIDPRVEKDFTLRRARSIWEGTARRIDADEMDALRLAEIEEMRRERQEAHARLADLDRKIAMADQAQARHSVA